MIEFPYFCSEWVFLSLLPPPPPPQFIEKDPKIPVDYTLSSIDKVPWYVVLYQKMERDVALL